MLLPFLPPSLMLGAESPARGVRIGTTTSAKEAPEKSVYPILFSRSVCADMYICLCAYKTKTLKYNQQSPPGLGIVGSFNSF